MATELRVVDLLAHPFLPCCDRRSTVGALISEAIDHFCPQELSPYEGQFAIALPSRRHCKLSKLLQFDDWARLPKGVTVRRNCLRLRVYAQPDGIAVFHCEVGAICYSMFLGVVRFSSARN
jgi:hypothetical protein